MKKNKLFKIKWTHLKIEFFHRKIEIVGEKNNIIIIIPHTEDAYTTVRTCSEQIQLKNQKRAAQHAIGFHGDIGDYMLVATYNTSAERKLVGIWRGPYQLVAHFNKKVEVLRTIVGKKKDFHMHHRRLKRYRPADSVLLDQ